MNIGIGILSWNNFEETKYLIDMILGEILTNNNYYYLYIVDNCSRFEQIKYLESIKSTKYYNYVLIKNKENIGISKSKNIFIKKAINDNCKYLFMFDNDVVPLKGSFNIMIDYMEKNKNVGCFGHHIDYYFKDKNLINSNNMPENIYKLEIMKNVKSGKNAIRSWTHYSIFRIDVFKKGVFFDECGPFGKRGYGFDDDDLGMQIHKKGYDIHCFINLKCFHNINSSIPFLKENC
jgi:GT2 family glycosyltransferase